MQQIHDWELSLIQAFHALRTEDLDRFFYFLNYFDRPEFMMIIVPIIWLCISWSWGLRVIILGLVSQFAIISLKTFFSFPRPYFLDPQLAVLEVKGFGFPSGAAQSTVLFGGLLVSKWRSKWAWLVSGNYFFWVSLSRVYLGVHFFSDLLGGWLSGGAMLWAFLRYHARVENWIKKCPMAIAYPILQTLLLIYMVQKTSLFSIQVASVSLGLGLGMWVSKKNGFYLSQPQSYWDLFFRCFIGISGSFLTVYFVEKSLGYFMSSNTNGAIFLKFFLVALWNSLGASWLIRHYFCFKRRKV